MPQIEQPQVQSLLDFKALTFDPALTNPALLPRFQRAASTEISLYRCPSFRGNRVSSATEFAAGGIFTNVALTQYVGMGASTINRLLDPRVQPDGVLFPPKYRIKGGVRRCHRPGSARSTGFVPCSGLAASPSTGFALSTAGLASGLRRRVSVTFVPFGGMRSVKHS